MRKLKTFLCIIICALFIMGIACDPQPTDGGDSGDGGDAGDGGDDPGTLIWSDDFEDGLDPYWHSDSPSDQPLVISTEEVYDGTQSALSQGEGYDIFVGNQFNVTVGEINEEELPQVRLWYNADNIGSATFGIWDLNLGGTPQESIDSSDEMSGWNEMVYELNENSINIWIGSVGGSSTDQIYIDDVRVYNVEEVFGEQTTTRSKYRKVKP
jgi:hypothetical protein